MKTFKDRAVATGKAFRLNEEDSVETFILMHEIIEQLIDGGIPIRLDGFFRTSYVATTFQDNIKIGANKKKLKGVLKNGKSLYFHPEQKICMYEHKNEGDKKRATSKDKKF